MGDPEIILQHKKEKILESEKNSILMFKYGKAHLVIWPTAKDTKWRLNDLT
jgi:hypothetical protein